MAEMPQGPRLLLQSPYRDGSLVFLQPEMGTGWGQVCATFIAPGGSFLQPLALPWYFELIHMIFPNYSK